MELYNKGFKDKLYYVLPIIAIIAIVPLIVHLKIVTLDDVVAKSWNGQAKNYDFFSYYKMVWFLVFAILSFIFFIIKLCDENNVKFIRKTILYIPLGFYSVFVIISALQG